MTRASVPSARLHAVARDRPQSRCGCSGSSRANARGRRRRPRFPRASMTGDRRARRRRAARNTWWSNRFPQLRADDRVFLGRVRAPSVAADLCGRPRRPRRRPLQGGGDLGVPLIGVGFMYPQGYFHQHVSAEGWQEESYERLNWADAAISRRSRRMASRASPRCRSAIGRCWSRSGGSGSAASSCTARYRSRRERAMGSRAVGAPVRRRSRNADPAGNYPRHRRRARAQGARLRAGVFHLNEGHAAFVVLQRIRELIEQGASFDARSKKSGDDVFTTHTPVPAGHDAFPFHLVEKHLAGCWGTLGPNRERFLALGAYDNGGGAQFNMTALALRSAGRSTRSASCTAKSRARCGRRCGPASLSERPVTAVTNGVHVPTWIAADLAELFTPISRHRLARAPRRPGAVGARLAIPDEECGPCVRRCADTSSPSSASARGSAGPSSTSAAARRRRRHAARARRPDHRLRPPVHRLQAPELIFHDPERLARILNAADGRCRSSSPARRTPPTTSASTTPADLPAGPRTHVRRARGVRRDYDCTSPILVQGCDVWLNNPRKPMEASGTSGMKPAMNGGRN